MSGGREISLVELRNIRGLTQIDLGDRIGFPQNSISRFEKQSDCLVSTLMKYLDGMGGQLTLRVCFLDGDQIDVFLSGESL